MIKTFFQEFKFLTIFFLNVKLFSFFIFAFLEKCSVYTEIKVRSPKEVFSGI